MSQDPTTKYPKPPFPQQHQDRPESEAQMDPRPDYGLDSYEGHGRLGGQAALITGGDSGIGRAVALAFAREGADVLVSYYEADEDAGETRRAVEDSGRRCLIAKGDVGEEAHCRALVEQAISGFGRLDVLVNNAAYQMVYDSIEEIPGDEIERVFRTNVTSMFHLVKAALPHMKPGATIINTASIQAFQPSPELLHYASTKGAIVTFTKGLAEELGPRGIRVNAVAPGPVWTPLIPMSFPAEQVATFGEDVPLGRPAQPVEVAHAYVFLASQESSYVSGQILGVTGGKPLS
jgi:NAD(P)-dependent dehydrogenase (short-subunit alcohol dehydrogenase family)